MKKSRLVEVFESVNKIKLDSNSPLLEANFTMVSPEEKPIVDDILSLNEDLNSIKTKLLAYGKQGLLTMAILFAVAKGVNANAMGDVISTGIEYVKDDQTKTDFYSACVGYTAKLSGDEKSDLTRKKALIECRIYFENLRDHQQPKPLSHEAAIVKNFVLQQLEKGGANIQSYVQYGKNIHTTDSTKTQF